MPASTLTENIKMQNSNGAPVRREVSRTQRPANSPGDTFSSPPPSASWGMHHNRRHTGSFGASSTGGPAPLAKLLKPFKEEDIKILLLENVNQTGKDILSQQGYQVESLKSSLPEDQLIEKIRCAARCAPLFLHIYTNSAKGHSCARNPFKDQADLSSSLSCQKPHRGRVLLHRHQPSRPNLRPATWHLRLQLTLLKFPISRRTRHRRNNLSSTPIGRPQQ